ncbi:MAG: RagB/SusD family nutrient uptake outer membrane protein, partial [Prevotella sp.]
MKAIKYIVTALCAISLTGCNLEREDYTEISPDNFPKTENDLRLDVNALYYEFCTGYWNGEAIYGANYGGYQVISDMSSGDLWSCWGWESDNLYYQQWFA